MLERREKKEDFLEGPERLLPSRCVLWCLASASARGRPRRPSASAPASEADALVAEALERSPDLRGGAGRGRRRARSRVAPAGALPDPMVTASTRTTACRRRSDASR